MQREAEMQQQQQQMRQHPQTKNQQGPNGNFTPQAPFQQHSQYPQYLYPNNGQTQREPVFVEVVNPTQAPLPTIPTPGKPAVTIPANIQGYNQNLFYLSPQQKLPQPWPARVKL